MLLKTIANFGDKATKRLGEREFVKKFSAIAEEALEYLVMIDTAARLALYGPVSAQFGLGIQQQYDGETFQDKLEGQLKAQIRPYQEKHQPTIR